MKKLEKDIIKPDINVMEVQENAIQSGSSFQIEKGGSFWIQ